MTMSDALTGVTASAARALALDADRGRLEPGKRADLALFGVTEFRDLPYWFGHNPCQAVVKDGRVVMQRDS